MRCVVLFSGGRNSSVSLHLMAARGCSICCLAAFSNCSDSSLFSSLDVRLVEKQATALRLPLRVFRLSGKKQSELMEVQEAFSQLKRDYSIRGMITGDSVPTPHFPQLDALCRVLGIQLIAPLLEAQKEAVLASALQDGFSAVPESIAAQPASAAFEQEPARELAVPEVVAQQ